MTSHIQKNTKRPPSGGNAAVELALVLPILALMMMGAMDFARVFFTGVELASAVRAGVQYGAQSNARSGDSAGMTQAANDDAKDIGGITATATRYCQCSDGTSVDCLTGTCGAYGVPRIFVQVTGQKTFQPTFSYPGIPSAVNLNRRAIMRAQ
jgi:Flp pilus assembly protein TadG